MIGSLRSVETNPCNADSCGHATRGGLRSALAKARIIRSHDLVF
jgi:hypothetical protein